MKKALVINGASFAENKVETITISEPIPCTGITLSQNSISSTAIGTEVTLTATVTPVDTTDTITWVSSDTDVATVANGTVTITGIGSATITAMCGTQSATCAVTATHTVDADTAYHAENGAYYGESMDLQAGKNHIGRASGVRGRLYYSTEEYGLYRAFSNVAFDGQYCIPLPKGTTKVTITPPEGLRTRTCFVLANANEKQTYVTGADGNSALGIYPFVNGSGTSYPVTIDISEYTDANSFIMSVYAPTSGDASAVTGHTMLEFS